MYQSVYAARRARVLERLGGGVLVLPATRVARRNGDVDHPYRPDSDLLYLTGFEEPESVLVLAPHADKPFTLFVRPRDKDQEIWTGRRAGVEGAVRDHGADQAFTIDQLDQELPKLLVGAHTVHFPLGLDPEWDARLVQTTTRLRQRTRTGAVVPGRLADVGPLLHELRLIKDEHEIAALERAAELTRRGFLRVLGALRPGLHEYEVEAELLYEYRRGGGTGPGYEPIVASGVNATILHYRTGRDVLRDGDVLLIDSGCEVDGYTADVTRTFPIGGEFSPAQRALYDVVLEAHLAAIDAVRPGTTRDAVHEVATRALIRGLVRLGLLAGDEDAIWKDRSFRRFYMHGTSHWLGLDVHDAGSYHAAGTPRPLAPGMVLTVEPGLYVAEDDDQAPAGYRGIGIRIEDDVLVTPQGRRVLTEAIPRTPDEIARVRAEAARARR